MPSWRSSREASARVSRASRGPRPSHGRLSSSEMGRAHKVAAALSMVPVRIAAAGYVAAGLEHVDSGERRASRARAVEMRRTPGRSTSLQCRRWRPARRKRARRSLPGLQSELDGFTCEVSQRRPRMASAAREEPAAGDEERGLHIRFSRAHRGSSRDSRCGGTNEKANRAAERKQVRARAPWRAAEGRTDRFPARFGWSFDASRGGPRGASRGLVADSADLA
jgi:hypothetical protein